MGPPRLRTTGPASPPSHRPLHLPPLPYHSARRRSSPCGGAVPPPPSRNPPSPLVRGDRLDGSGRWNAPSHEAEKEGYHSALPADLCDTRSLSSSECEQDGKTSACLPYALQRGIPLRSSYSLLEADRGAKHWEWMAKGSRGWPLGKVPSHCGPWVDWKRKKWIERWSWLSLPPFYLALPSLLRWFSSHWYGFLPLFATVPAVLHDFFGFSLLAEWERRMHFLPSRGAPPRMTGGVD